MKIAIIVFAVMSLVAFALYGADKRKAKRGQWRIPEKVLLLWSFLGGAIGGSAAMLLFRHKTKHWYFAIGFPLITVVEYAALVYFLFIH